MTGGGLWAGTGVIMEIAMVEAATISEVGTRVVFLWVEVVVLVATDGAIVAGGACVLFPELTGAGGVTGAAVGTRSEQVLPRHPFLHSHPQSSPATDPVDTAPF